MLLVTRYCTVCAADTQFEVLADCVEHGVDCPEVICIDCGAIYLAGPWTEVDVVATSEAPRRGRSGRRTSAA
ncbi:MAG: hypothetical protein ABR520_08280 [Mycobacteriales bacterium]